MVQIFKNIGIGDLLMAIRRCSSLLRCCRCSMSDVYIGRNLLIPLAFGALVLENELQYNGLAVCINSAYDACILYENFVKFGLVTPELIGLIYECQV